MKSILQKNALYFLIVLSFIIQFSHAGHASNWATGQGYAEARLINATTHTGHSKNVTIGVELRLNDQWKTYWRTPGDTGLTPQFNWKKSNNLDKATTHWPAPTRFVISGYDNFGYKNKVTFPIDITVKDPEQDLNLNLNLSILVCHEICVPESIDLTLNIPAGNAQPSQYADIITSALNQVPEISDSHILSAKISDNALFLTLSAPLNVADKLDIFVENDENLTFGTASKISDTEYSLPLTSKLYGQESLRKLLIEKLAILTFTGTNPLFEQKITIENYTSSSATADNIKKETPNLWTMIGIALIGGLILNFMPCVLPVLSLKILSIISHSETDEIKKIRIGFVATILGILSSFWILAFSLIILKNAGSAIGWGIQFQNPIFLGFMVVIVTLFALNLWGSFEIPLPRFISRTLNKTHDHEPTLIGHFLTGMLATLLATPCSAPFLGTAIGFALSQDAVLILVIFTALGIGLSSPYLLVVIFPRLAHYLPKPGQWMMNFKRVLAVAMLFTALWLGSVLFSVISPTNTSQNATYSSSGLEWIVFDEQDIERRIKSGDVVFVDVTADWCLTCKANKRIVLNSTEIQELFKTSNIVLMRADWTRPNDKITKFLQKHGRYGIPFNIIYSQKSPNGYVLPELLSKEDVIKAVKAVQK